MMLIPTVASPFTICISRMNSLDDAHPPTLHPCQPCGGSAVFWRVSGIVHPKIEVETSAKCGRIGRRSPIGLDMAPIRSSSAVW